MWKFLLRVNSVAADTPFPEISDEFLSSPQLETTGNSGK